MNLSILQETVKDWEAWRAAVHRAAKRWTLRSRAQHSSLKSWVDYLKKKKSKGKYTKSEPGICKAGLPGAPDEQTAVHGHRNCFAPFSLAFRAHCTQWNGIQNTNPSRQERGQGTDLGLKIEKESNPSNTAWAGEACKGGRGREQPAVSILRAPGWGRGSREPPPPTPWGFPPQNSQVTYIRNSRVFRFQRPWFLCYWQHDASSAEFNGHFKLLHLFPTVKIVFQPLVLFSNYYPT